MQAYVVYFTTLYYNCKELCDPDHDIKMNIKSVSRTSGFPILIEKVYPVSILNYGGEIIISWHKT